MTWNYDYIIAELFVLSVVFVYYTVRPKLPLGRLRLYLMVMILETIVVISDALGAYALDHWVDIYPLSYGLNMIYFSCFFLRSYIFFLLSLRILKLEYWRKPAVCLILHATTFVLEMISLSTPLTGWIFYIQEGQYHRGSLYMLTYSQFAVYLIAVLILVARNWDRLNKKTRITVPLIWCILAVGYIIRWFFSAFLLANMFYMVVIIIILFNYFDPESFLEPRTGLYNEHAFREMMTEKIGTSNFALLSCVVRDRDTIRKVYNISDTTELRRQIGDYLRKNMSDTLIFYTNSRNYIVLADDIMQLKSIKQQIIERFEKAWTLRDHRLYLDVGIVEMDNSLPVDSVDALERSLESAMDQVEKAKGPVEMSVEKLSRQIKVREALDQALEDNAVELYLQPIFTADSRKLAGAEALARLYDKDLGLIYPGEFISQAEEDGSIGQVGFQMFRKVCRFLSLYNDDLHLRWVNINLSPVQCMDRELPGKLKAILDEYHLDPSMIHLEITEETYVDSGILGERVERLKDIGFEIDLDDFGCGYSNIASVLTYPMDVIKLDRSLVLSYFEHPSAILESLVSTLGASGYTIIAEGVEEEYMVNVLAEMGCHYIQGYYFSRPVPVTEFVNTYHRDLTKDKAV